MARGCMSPAGEWCDSATVRPPCVLCPDHYDRLRPELKDYFLHCWQLVRHHEAAAAGFRAAVGELFLTESYEI
jgi:hypothetical protein